MSTFTNPFIRKQSEKKFTPRTDPKGTASIRPKPKKRENWIIFMSALAVNLGIAYLLNILWKIGEADALTTTANGMLTLYSANKGVMPITLVEPPLSGLLQLVFIPILKEFHLAFLAGPILSAIAGALSLLFLNLILLQMNGRPGFRWVLLALVQISPSFLYSSATGTPDAVFLFIVLFVIWGALQIAYNNMSFLICGFGLAIGFFVKYESLAITLGLVLALVVYQWKANDNWRVELEGRFIAFITPIIYVVGLWLLFNGFNMHDAFYFIKHLNTPAFAPDIVINAGISHPFFLGWDNIFDAVRIGVNRVLQNSLVLVVTVLFAFIIALINKKKYYFSVLLIILTLPLLDIVQIFLGLQSPGLYQWAYAVPFGMILIGLLSQQIIPEKRYLLLILTVILTAGSILLTFESIANEDVSISEQRLSALLSGNTNHELWLRESDPYWIYRQDGPIIALEIDSMNEGTTILLNAADAAPVALFTRHPERILVTTELDFNTFFTYPGNQADEVLLLEETQPINSAYSVQEYPALSQANVNYAIESWQSPNTILNWKIFVLNFE
ncbi:MAG: hypothetical protein H0S79_08640 [Anaerolineaceae bacterium]|nr:hypothetical protein [Anaerolineaceae bacterium]